MAKYNITHSCGHDAVHQLVGPHKERERRISWLENTLCYDCYQADLAKQRAEATAAAQQEAAEQELPELTGTEKQIAWAIRIRGDILKQCHKTFEEKINEDDPQEIIRFFDWLYNQKSASWWIDHRGQQPYFLAHDFKKECPKAPKIDAIDEAAVKAEAIIRPENPSVETPTEIRITDNVVTVYLPIKNDKLREIVKEHGYHWDNGWQRAYNTAKTNIQDRTAEMGSKLLVSGFVIQIMDATTRGKVVSGSYQPEKTRWISKLVTGTHAGWFCLDWSRKEDFYKAARKIAGSRYDKPNVVIPPQNYDEVQDFAGMYDFSLTEGAKAIITEQIEIRKNSMVVTPKIKDTSKVAQMIKPQPLEIEAAEVPDEFKD